MYVMCRRTTQEYIVPNPEVESPPAVDARDSTHDKPPTYTAASTLYKCTNEYFIAFQQYHITYHACHNIKAQYS